MPEHIPENIRKEIEKLVKDLNYHNYRYYVLDAPLIPDEEYDRLYRRLKELEEHYHYALPDPPAAHKWHISLFFSVTECPHGLPA